MANFLLGTPSNMVQKLAMLPYNSRILLRLYIIIVVPRIDEQIVNAIQRMDYML